MTRKVNNNNTILVPIDFSEMSLNALDHAIEIAKKYKNEITLLHIVEDGEIQLPNLDKLADDITKKHDIIVHKLVKEGKIANVINEVAEVGNYDSIMMGSNGSSGLQLFMGSNASKVIKSATVPVIVIKEKNISEGYKKIVMPVDLTIESRQKVDWAIHLAKKFDSIIHIIFEKENDEYFENNIKASLNQITNKLKLNGVNYLLHKLDNKTYPGKLFEDTIVYAHEIDADLILIMTQAEGNIFDFVIGSHAQHIVNKSEKVAVMVVQPSATGFSFDF